MDGEHPHDVFDVVGAVDTEDEDSIVRVRSPYLFEIGEELKLQIEHDGAIYDAVAQVRGHVGPGDAQITELEIVSKTERAGNGS